MVRRIFVLLCLLLVLAGDVMAQEGGYPPITAENAARLTPIRTWGFELPRSNVNFWSPLQIAWSPDGATMVLAGYGGVYGYAVDESRVLPLATSPYALGAAWQPDGALLAVVDTRSVRLLDFGTSQQPMLPADIPLGQLAFSPDGTMLAAAPSSFTPPGESLVLPGSIYLWNMQSRDLLGVIGYPRTPVGPGMANVPEIVFSLDGQWLASSMATQIHLWDYRNPAGYHDPNLYSKAENIAWLEGHSYVPEDAPIYDWVAFRSLGGEYALWLTADDGTALWALPNQPLSPVIPGETGEGPFDAEGVPQRFNGYEQLSRRDLVTAFGELQDLVFGAPPEIIQIVSSHTAGAVQQRYRYDAAQDAIVDERTGALYRAVEVDGVGVFQTAQGDVLFTLGAAEGYSVGERRSPQTMTFDDPVLHLAVDPANGILAVVVAAPEGEPGILLVDPATDTLLGTLDTAIGSEIHAVAFSRDGSLLVSLELGGTIHLFDVEAGQEIAALSISPSPDNLAFSPDGRLLLTTGHEAVLWAVP